MSSTNVSEQLRIAQEKLKKTELPELLAKIVLNGQQEEALKLLIAWGTHEKDTEAVWSEAKALLKA